MDRTALEKRLWALSRQDFDGYAQRERPEVVDSLREILRAKLTTMDEAIAELEKEYRTLVSGTDTDRRMEVYVRKNKMAEEAEAIRIDLNDNNKILIRSRRIYADSVELQESLREQGEIRLALWGRESDRSPDFSLIKG